VGRQVDPLREGRQLLIHLALLVQRLVEEYLILLEAELKLVPMVKP